jgi:hypothetical protein
MARRIELRRDETTTTQSIQLWRINIVDDTGREVEFLYDGPLAEAVCRAIRESRWRKMPWGMCDRQGYADFTGHPLKMAWWVISQIESRIRREKEGAST